MKDESVSDSLTLEGRLFRWECVRNEGRQRMHDSRISIEVRLKHDFFMLAGVERVAAIT